jgi:GNAT superfamily N-acetyltransferase
VIRQQPADPEGSDHPAMGYAADAGFPAADLEIRDTTDIAPDVVLELFRHVDWARHRSIETVAAALPQTTLLLTGWQRGRCVAMLRALSDGVYRALIEDVIVHPDYRGRCYGRRLLEDALTHPRIRHVEEVVLFTGVPAFYERLGFIPVGSAMKLRRSAAP